MNKCTEAGGIFKFYVADWFGLMNDKMGGDLKKIQARPIRLEASDAAIFELLTGLKHFEHESNLIELHRGREVCSGEQDSKDARTGAYADAANDTGEDSRTEAWNAALSYALRCAAHISQAAHPPPALSPAPRDFCTKLSFIFF